MTSDTATEPRRDPQPDGGSAAPGAEVEPTAWQLRLRRFGYLAPQRTDVRSRLVPPFRAPGARVWTSLGMDPALARKLAHWSAWGGPLLVALFAGVLRFWRLGSPEAVIFDETYYAKDAWSLLRYGYEGTWSKEANDALLGDPQQILLSPEASYVVHPPVGKWTIAVGEWLFGLTPFGWRFMTALLGTLSVLLLCRIGRRLFRSTALGCLAGALLAVDGLHFVMSRTALLDLVLGFWLLAAFGCLLVDRDKARAGLASALERASRERPVGDSERGEGEVRPDPLVGDRTRLGARPWRLAAGLCLGLACATKWNGLYVLAAFGLLTVLWDVGARRTAGARRPVRSTLRRDVLPAFLSLIPVAVVTYVASWAGWFATQGGYFRQWANGRESAWSVVPEALRSLWHYQHAVYEFHVGLTSPHTYQSNPWSWLVLGRPVSYFYESPKAGRDGCPADAAEGCAREVLALGTPLLWWAGCLAVLYLLYRWGFARDWRAGAVLCGLAAGWLPWFLYQERTIFLFYAVVFVPFLCLAVTMMIGAILGPPGSSERRRVVGAIGAGALVLLIIWNFVYFYPIYSGQSIPIDSWRDRMWLSTWI
ncbi:dolichyl-phosphate-mannose--protein mannosyltransferase [Streptomyces sp. TP-A0874]|uniref:dolichyl-phosphate-mannose--protein mannosyltransferase n=1 Tax=Streptomyces sp. TP-A0874 TaxID=549819 RepID=UPI0008532472|nr:phospholipid carrier-dependent glycosyltransferase [Streptomyces sp. TP-A0874]